ncbi:uncharacterized protein LOC129770316 [Toxorhynchites rutilus septentrionalis]|uniref:uncharacterized protein LOC129770316 n=1 Tax=Toxorhynchites rutilus septentrionalis TaxID=329112 RepID=UPI0024785769|nr:uncharacterized protein LOC129770316 [Toxorhynchites rutilus septentrionalis]
MMRKHTRTSDRKKWSQNGLNAAMRHAFLVHCVPRKTLERYLHCADPLQLQLLGSFGNIFTTEQYSRYGQRFYGVTTREIRKLAYDLAERNDIPHPSNSQKQLAGIDWLAGFRKYHPQLSFRTSEATSVARAQEFNRIAVGKFYDSLENVQQKYNIPRQFNVDENSVIPVQTRNSKILTMRGKRQKSAITSAEC